MIGIFDSGFGGLTVLKAILKNEKLSNFDYLYLGDNARAPYGAKSQEVIYGYTLEAVEYLFRQGCKLVILACNTASAEALRRIQQEYLPSSPYAERRVLGVIIPVAEEAVAKVKRKKEKGKNRKNLIGIIGTRSAIASRAYEKEIEKIMGEMRLKGDKELAIYAQPAPLLVPLVEEGWTKKPEARKILKAYLKPLKDKHIDYLILGCTHYPLLMKQIKEVCEKRCEVLDSPRIVSDKLADYLTRHQEISSRLSKKEEIIFCTTDDPERFRELGSRFLGLKIDKAEKISL